MNRLGWWLQGTGYRGPFSTKVWWYRWGPYRWGAWLCNRGSR